MGILSNIGMDTEGVENECPDAPLTKPKPKQKPSPWLTNDHTESLHRSGPANAMKSAVLAKLKEKVTNETILFQPISMQFCTEKLELCMYKQKKKFGPVSARYKKKLMKESERTATRLQKMKASGVQEGTEEMEEFLSSRDKIKQV